MKLPKPKILIDELKSEGWTLQRISDHVGASPSALSRAKLGRTAIAWGTYKRLYELHRKVLYGY